MQRNFGVPMIRRSRSYRDSLLQDLTDPAEAVAYLNAAKEDSLEMFLVALKDVAQARQMAKVAKGTGLQRETLYRSLSEQGNPTIGTLASIFGFLDMDFTMRVKETRADEHIVDDDTKDIPLPPIKFPKPKITGSFNKQPQKTNPYDAIRGSKLPTADSNLGIDENIQYIFGGSIDEARSHA
jgi:probable addiction module antidote protein